VKLKIPYIFFLACFAFLGCHKKEVLCEKEKIGIRAESNKIQVKPGSNLSFKLYENGSLRFNVKDNKFVLESGNNTKEITLNYGLGFYVARRIDEKSTWSGTWVFLRDVPYRSLDPGTTTIQLPLIFDNEKLLQNFFHGDQFAIVLIDKWANTKNRLIWVSNILKLRIIESGKHVNFE